MLETMLKHINKNRNDIAINKYKDRKAITYEQLFNVLLEHGKDTHNILKIGENTFKRVMRKHFSKVNNQEKWVTCVLRTFDHRRCGGCNDILPIDNFSKIAGTYMNKNHLCKSCDSTRSKKYIKTNKLKCNQRSKDHYKNNKSDYLARNIKRKADKSNATPAWVNLEKIKIIYKLRPDGYHVDHIVPLNGEHVCGLHVENNLQYLLARDNLSKSNKY